MRTAYAADVAEVVVHPQDGSVLRDPESRVEDRQDLLVRAEQLRRTLRQHRALRGEDLLEDLYLLLRRLPVRHSPVVDAAHADRPQNISCAIYML